MVCTIFIVFLAANVDDNNNLRAETKLTKRTRTCNPISSLVHPLCPYGAYNTIEFGLLAF